MLTAIVTETVQRDSAADEIEWAQLAASRPSAYEMYHADTGVKFANTPHPLSYGAKLPMSGLGLGTSKPTHRWTLTAAEKKVGRPVVAVAKPVIRANSAHPDSYRADLPLRGLGLNGIRVRKSWPLTADEKASLAGRPIRYSKGA